MKIILGSQSSNRRSILEMAGYEFEVMSADIDERLIRYDDPKKLTLAIAQAKTQALLPQINTPSILITADTVVVCNNKILEKPRNYQEVLKFFKAYEISPIEVVTAVVVTNIASKIQKTAVDKTKIWFKPFSQKEIDDMMERGQVLNFAGGFTNLDSIVKKHIIKIEGDSDTATGLPIKIVDKFIKCLT